MAADDVVILPAFGVTVGLLADLDRRGCTLVDTTCGSVLNVWKNVKRYAEQGYTSVIHGKVWHEETQATASQAVEARGAYLVVFDDEEADAVCEYIRSGGDREAFRLEDHAKHRVDAGLVVGRRSRSRGTARPAGASRHHTRRRAATRPIGGGTDHGTPTRTSTGEIGRAHV